MRSKNGSYFGAGSPAETQFVRRATMERDPDKLDPRTWKIIGVVLLGPLMAQMDSTIVNVSLSSLRDALNASLSSAQWVISGYLLALALMLPLNGWIVDRLGAKRVYLICFSTFTLASILCGAARTIDQLICARILQGLAGGLLAPLAQMMLAGVAGRHMARVIGYAATPVLLAPIVGPIAAGAILKYLNWSWLFYVNVPIGILAVVSAVLLLPKDQRVEFRRSFDLLGFLLISPGLASFLYGMEQLSHGSGKLFCAAGLILLSVFVWHARRAKANALIDLELFGNRVFSVAAVTQFLTNGVLYAGQFLIPLYLTLGCGLSAEKVGWMLAPMGLGMIIVYPMMGAMTDRFGCRTVAVGGILLNIVGTLPFLWMSYMGEFSSVVVAVSLFARGAGQGMTGIPTIAAAYASVPRAQLSLATTAMNVVQRLGGPIATTTLAIVISLSGAALARLQPSLFIYPMLSLVVLQLVVLVPATRLPMRIPQSSRPA